MISKTLEEKRIQLYQWTGRDYSIYSRKQVEAMYQRELRKRVKKYHEMMNQ